MESKHAAAAETRDSTVPPDGVVRFDADGFRYAYQVITGRDALFDLQSDPLCIHNLARSHAARTREMRRALESRLAVPNLDTLRSRYADSIRTLQTLGYL